MAIGEINPVIKSLTKMQPPRGPNIYVSGTRENEKGHVRYSLPSSKYPNLLIASPIFDAERNVIMPGYYELMLSDDRTMLSLAQRGNIIATLPVFKLEEDKSQEADRLPMDNKSLKKSEKEKKKAEKKRQKLIKAGQIPDMPEEIYSNASIEYEKEGAYYLVKYERGRVKAWGALKVE